MMMLVVQLFAFACYYVVGLSELELKGIIRASLNSIHRKLQSEMTHHDYMRARHMFPRLLAELSQPSVGVSSCRVRLSKWYNRFGNNILQLGQMLRVAARTGYVALVRDHPSPLMQFVANQSFSVPCTGMAGCGMKPDFKSLCEMKRMYYYQYDFDDVGENLADIEKTRLALRNSGVAKLIHKAADAVVPTQDYPFSWPVDDTLCMHVRSGDLFDVTVRGHKKYWQPPLSWYTKVIRRHRTQYGSSSPVLLVVEDKTGNPVTTALEYLHRNDSCFALQSKTSEIDFVTLMRCKHLAVSLGTFASTAAILSFSAEKIHVPTWERPLPHFLAQWTPSTNDSPNVTVYHHFGYANSLWQKTNTSLLEYMLKYPERLIVEKSLIQSGVSDPNTLFQR